MFLNKGVFGEVYDRDLRQRERCLRKAASSDDDFSNHFGLAERLDDFELFSMCRV
jgi:hypothetical protein